MLNWINGGSAARRAPTSSTASPEVNEERQLVWRSSNAPPEWEKAAKAARA
jgi:hypothetical protein